MGHQACNSFVTCLYDYQTLIAGLLAIVAAAVGAVALMVATRAPINVAALMRLEEQERRRRFLGAVLFQDFSKLRSRCRMAEGVVRVLHAGNHQVNDASRAEMRLGFNPILEDWEFMSLAPPSFLREVIALQKAVSDHNYDVDRAGTFTDNNWRESVLARLERIGAEANALGGQSTLLSRGEPLPT